MKNNILNNDNIPTSEESSLVNNIQVPIVRIGIVDYENVVDFKINGKFSILDEDNNKILKKSESELMWRIKVNKDVNAKFKYGVLVGEFRKKQEAEKLSEKLGDGEFNIQITKSGSRYLFKDKITLNNICYKVIAGYWDDKNEALSYKNTLNNDYNSVIVKKTESKFFYI